MANKHRGEVFIDLDTRYHLKFDTNALAELEDQLGYTLPQLDANNIGIKTLRSIFWAGLLHEIPNLTLKKAGELMDYSDIENISTKVKEALELAFGSSDPKKTKAGARGPGKN